MHDATPKPVSVSTTEARRNLSALIAQVQHPGSFAVLRRHGRPAAALVSMENLQRIWNAEDVEAVIAGTYRPSGRAFDADRWGSDREAAEAVQQMQIDRLKERELLARQGLEEIPGGEIRGDVVFVPHEPDAAEERTWRRIWRRLGLWSGSPV